METKPEGRSLTQEEFQQVPHVIARPKARYAWSAGPAMGRFMDELKEGRIIGRSCGQCGRVLVPPRMFCERCFRPTDEWIYLPGTAVVETFSVSYIDTDATRISEPILVGVVGFDGAPPHSGIMHYFGEVSPEMVRIGLEVEPVWKPEKEREGAITDIRYFRPRREEDRR
ncbi:MAG: Zn-ribbon domain-containing OB-fold protein [Candidatus Bipolaricaulia bacterium]